MFRRFVLSMALLSLCAAPLLHGQFPGEIGGGQPGSSVSTDCTDPMLGPSAGCFSSQQSGSRATGGESSLPGPVNLGTVPEEGGYGPYGARNSLPDVPPIQHFPPDKPTEFQKFVAETTGQFLPIYGQNLFRQVPSTFAPSNQAPIPADYVIGPGDQLRIRIWGQVNFSGNLRVDRSGNIYLPQIGTIEVAGLPFSELDTRLRSSIARYFRNFDLWVDMGQIRSIQVYISGQARRPGAYTVSALSSLVDALFASGGPSPEGSLRHILLKRDGKTVTDFDLYALLLHGDKSKDARLLPEDVIYIPPAGPQVAITGSVRTPGIFELRSGQTAGDLIAMAGGATAVASASRISLDRIDEHRTENVQQVDFNAAGLATVLADGDILRVYPILPAYNKTVTLRGNIANPGRFSWYPGMRLSDLIPDIDSLVSRDYWWQRSHLGLPAPEFEPVVSELGHPPPQSSESSQKNPANSASSWPANTSVLEAQDQSESSVTAGKDASSPSEQGANATLAGAETHGSNPNQVHGLRMNSIRLPADQIDWNYAVIERTDPNSLKPSLIPFDLGKLVLDHDSSQNLALEPGDTVTIFSQSDIRGPLDQQVKYVELEGEFVHPGFYSIAPGETLRDVVRRAGGLTPQAYLYGSEFTRESARILQQQRLDDYLRSLTIAAERGTEALAASATSTSSADVATSRAVNSDMIARLSQVKATGRIVLQFRPTNSSLDDIPAISLENGDKFVVPFAPANINVVGAVYDQNSYLYQRGRTLGYYLQLAGGANRNADWRHAFLIRADGSVVSRDHRSGAGFWKQSFDDVKLNPGDTIVVPDKTLRPTALRGIIEWSQIFTQFALGAAAVNVL